MYIEWHSQSGMSLIETIVSIVILSVSMAAITSVLSNSVLNSVNPMIREKAIAVADAYLETVRTQHFVDPDGGDTGTCEEGDDSNRANYDDVNDYDCVEDNDGARDQLGNLIAGLEGYNVEIDTQNININGAPASQISVNVTYDGISNFSVLLNGYRVDYP